MSRRTNDNIIQFTNNNLHNILFKIHLDSLIKFDGKKYYVKVLDFAEFRLNKSAVACRLKEQRLDMIIPL